MMRALDIRSFFLACLTCVMAGMLIPTAGAQDAAQAGLQPLEETDQARATIPAPHANRNALTETRLPGGRVTEIEVRSGASTYYLHPQTAAGGAQRDGGRTARWNILNFNLPQSGRAAHAVAQPAPVPPPPRAD